MLTRLTLPYWLLALMFAFASAVFSVPFWDWRTPHDLPVPRALFILVLALGFALLLLLTAFDTNTARRHLRGFMVFGVMFTGIFGSMQTQQQGQLDNVRSSPSYQRTADLLRQTNADIELRTRKGWGAYPAQERRADSLARALRQLEEDGEETVSPALAMVRLGVGVPAVVLAGLFAALASLIIDQGTRFAAIRIREITGKKETAKKARKETRPAVSKSHPRLSNRDSAPPKNETANETASGAGEGRPKKANGTRKKRDSKQVRMQMLRDYLGQYPDASLNEMADALSVSSRETVRRYLQELGADWDSEKNRWIIK